MVELAYGIDAPHRGRGLATEVAGALTEFAFADLPVIGEDISVRVQRRQYPLCR
jgi:hypothetical protein